MKVILKQDVKGLGRKGDAVEVAEGYGRNFLIPRGLAVPASEGALRSIEAARRAAAEKQQRLLRRAEELRQKLHGAEVVVRARAGEGGRLFGSVTNKDVADALNARFQVSLDRRAVELEEHPKALGTYAATVRLAPGVTATVTVKVVEG